MPRDAGQSRHLQAVGALDLTGVGRLVAHQHAQQGRLAAAVGTDEAHPAARADKQVESREDDLVAIRLGDAARFEQPARVAAGAGKIDVRAALEVAAGQLVDLAGQHLGALNARLLLVVRRARPRAATRSRGAGYCAARPCAALARSSDPPCAR